MRWSLNMGKIFGINFRIHATFFLLLFFIFISVLRQAGLHKAFLSTLLVCAVFGCVLIHEIGHSLIARRFGKQARSITLLPIGGVAAMEEIPDKPGQEIAMAIVGPFINLIIAGIIYAFVGRWSGLNSPTLYPDSLRTFFASLITINIMLAVFNMIPAFPMDGGRVLRGILAMGMDYFRATSIAVLIGQALSMLFIFFGIFFNWWLALIGVFLYMGAGAEKHHVMLRTILRDVPASAAISTDFQTLRSDQHLSDALERIYHGCQQDFPVVGERGVEGILTRAAILSAIHEKGVNVAVSELMERTFPIVDTWTPLEEVYQKLLASRKAAAAVVDGNEIKGIISLDGIGRYLMIQAALGKAGGENISHLGMSNLPH